MTHLVKLSIDMGGNIKMQPDSDAWLMQAGTCSRSINADDNDEVCTYTCTPCRGVTLRWLE